MPNPNDPSEHECKACHDTGYRPFSNRLCSCVAGTLRILGDKVIAPLDHSGVK